MRQRVASGSPYEASLGFSRAVRAGRFIAISGTAATGSGGNAAVQARQCLEIVRDALAQAGGQLSDVVRTRILLVDIADWEAVGQVHGEFFGEIRPALTVMQVSRFIDPGWLVEIEADAIIEDNHE